MNYQFFIYSSEKAMCSEKDYFGHYEKFKLLKYNIITQISAALEQALHFWLDFELSAVLELLLQ